MSKRLSPILNDDERQEFTQLQRVIKKHTETAWEWIESIHRVRQARLYREDYKTFESFCQEECGFTSRRGNQLIAALQFRIEAKANGAPVPENENQARKANSEPEMTPEDLPDPDKETSTNEPPDLGTNVPSGAKPPRELPKEFRDSDGFDSMGYPIPKAVASNYRKREEIQKLIDLILSVKVHVLNSVKAQEKTYWRLGNGWEADVDGVAHGLKSIQPYAVCPYCQGRTYEQCTNCGHTGVVGKFYYEQTTPAELRRLREIQIKKIND